MCEELEEYPCDDCGSDEEEIFCCPKCNKSLCLDCHGTHLDDGCSQ